MATESADASLFQEVPPKSNEWKRMARAFVRRKVSVIGLTIIFLLIVAAIFSPWLAPYDPYKIDMGSALQNPNSEHWLGTDEIGRDVLSRLIYGTRTSLMVGVVAVGVAVVIGVVLGLVSGYFGGWADAVIMRFIDALMAIPGMVLALVFAAMLGGGR